jgi:hypothetical protein
MHASYQSPHFEKLLDACCAVEDACISPAGNGGAPMSRESGGFWCPARAQGMERIHENLQSRGVKAQTSKARAH